MTSTAATRISHDQQPGRSDMDRAPARELPEDRFPRGGPGVARRQRGGAPPLARRPGQPPASAPATPRSRHSPRRAWTVTRPSPSPSARHDSRTTRARCPPATRNTTRAGTPPRWAVSHGTCWPTATPSPGHPPRPGAASPSTGTGRAASTPPTAAAAPRCSAPGTRSGRSSATASRNPPPAAPARHPGLRAAATACTASCSTTSHGRSRTTPASRTAARAASGRTRSGRSGRLSSGSRVPTAIARYQRRNGGDWSAFVAIAEQLTDDGWQPIDVDLQEYPADATAAIARAATRALNA